MGVLDINAAMSNLLEYNIHIHMNADLHKIKLVFMIIILDGNGEMGAYIGIKSVI